MYVEEMDGVFVDGNIARRTGFELWEEGWKGFAEVGLDRLINCLIGKKFFLGVK